MGFGRDDEKRPARAGPVERRERLAKPFANLRETLPHLALPGTTVVQVVVDDEALALLR